MRMKNKFLYICHRIPIKNQTNQMKKVFALLTAFVFVGLVACGPSAEEKKAQEEAAQKAADSTAH